MRVLVMSWRDMAHPAAGGSEVFIDRVAQQWVALGHEVTVFAARPPGLPPLDTRAGYRIVRGGGRLSVYRSARAWFREHGVGHFDAVVEVVNTIPFAAQGWIHDTPVVPLYHQTTEECWDFTVPWPLALVGRYWLEPRWVRANRERCVMAVSSSTAASLHRFGIRDVTVVGEGCDPVPVLRPPRQVRPTVIWVGRLVPYKRPDHFIEAMRLLADEVDDLQAWLVGSGPQLDKIRSAAPPLVEVMGQVSAVQKYELLARAHVHAATSVREGWGRVVTEAAAVGTVTVAYDRPGLRDSTLAAGGVLCDPTPRALARSLASTLADRAFIDAPRPALGGALPWAEVAESALAVLKRSAAEFTGTHRRGAKRQTGHGRVGQSIAPAADKEDR